jgi:hypothetical protein
MIPVSWPRNAYARTGMGSNRVALPGPLLGPSHHNKDTDTNAVFYAIHAEAV